MSLARKRNDVGSKHGRLETLASLLSFVMLHSVILQETELFLIAGVGTRHLTLKECLRRPVLCNSIAKGATTLTRLFRTVSSGQTDHYSIVIYDTVVFSSIKTHVMKEIMTFKYHVQNTDCS
jgi:hypothetical protein